MVKKYLKLLLIAALAYTMTYSSFGEVSAATKIAPKREMRAAWISTVANIDMKAGMSKAAYTKWAQNTVKELDRKNFNTIVFQVKPTADAMYPSKLAPWSRYLTGKKQGTNPGFDPLKIMMDTAHDYGMELHAWINPYRVTMTNQKLKDLATTNIAVKHPEWVVKNGAQYYLNPGIPEVQNYLIDVVQELVVNYDVDAIHMDDYFYPGVNFEDQKTFEQYGEEFENIGDWRRNNVNQLVEHINRTIKDSKPWVQFGISPSGIWRNSIIDPTGSVTSGQAHYDSLYADSREWIRSGSVDYITPQVYWSRKLAAANYSVLLDWWSREVESYPVNLYIGMADYKVNNNSDKTWKNANELAEQIVDNRSNGGTAGQMHFTLRDILANRIGYAALIEKQIYNTKALTPQTPWNGDEAPNKPLHVAAKKQGKTYTITIDNKKQNDARKYVIYRFAANSKTDYSNPKNIIGVVYDKKGIATFTDKNSNVKQNYTYGVSSISNTGIESEDAREVKTKK